MTGYLSDHEISWAFSLPDKRLAALPLVSTQNEPQDAPQQYECGCITVTRITDRDFRRGELPFEMRLASACGTEARELTRAVQR